MPTPTNLYEYYTGKGQALPSLDARSQTYQTAGLGTAADYIAKNKAGVAEPNNQLLSYLTSASSATDPKSTYVNNVAATPTYAGAMSKEQMASAQTPEQMAASGANSTPTIQPAAQTPADKAFADYLTSLTGAATISPEQQALQSKLNTETTDAQLARERALNSGETMGFAGGEAQRVGRNNDITIAGTAAQLQARQAYDTSRSTTLTGVAKARYEYEQSKLQQAQDANKPFELSSGQTRYDGKGNVVASLPSNPSTQSTGFTLQPGEKRYDTQGNLIASVAPKADAAIKGETIKSGGLVYTSADAGSDSKALEQSRGTDGFVDPMIYQQLYNAWISAGGLLKDFLSTYPPKNYVNPANTWLPSYLIPKSDGGFSY